MLHKLQQTIALALMANYANSSGIQEMTGEEDAAVLLAQYDFAVVSFYNSDPKALEVDATMEGAKNIIESKIAAGEWSERNLGWFRVDIEKHPELYVNENPRPDQMITGQGWRRMIGFQNDAFDTQAENENFFAHIVRELTGDWVMEVGCDHI